MANNSTAMKLTLKITSFIMRLLLNIIFYILVVILIVNMSKMAYQFTYQLFGPDTVDPIGGGRQIIFQIKKGESTMDIASKLELNRAIENKYSFYLKTKLSDYKIMPGTYQISSDMTYNEILTIITDYSSSIIKEEGVEDSTSDAGKSDAASGDNTEGSASTDTNAGANTDPAVDTNNNTNTN